MLLEDKEEKRRELIRRAQADQAKRLADIYSKTGGHSWLKISVMNYQAIQFVFLFLERMKILQDAEEAKKRKLYKELKENMEETAQVWLSMQWYDLKS